MNEEFEKINATIAQSEFNLLAQQVKTLDEGQLESLKVVIEQSLNQKRSDVLSDVEMEALFALFK